MARETKEQKELRWAAEAHIALVAKEAFKATMPSRLAELQKMASSCGVNTRVELTATGPLVEFSRYQYDDRGSTFEETLTYDSEEWQVECIENRLKAFKDEIEVRAARHKLAQDTFNTLSTEQKVALKEFIKYLV